MSYTALYRKWRPTSFEEVRGQDHIVKTLKNQINSGRIGHAYLFCGTRGTGKTSIAKIFARAVNCEHPVDGSPCGECSMCRQIAEGASLNVVEIDAASNNGVENIRDIREQVQYPPTDGRYRVYIIDEVHMLSIGAFNALLKTLEEPPSYVIFILATTEVHKIPITILSRCQRYDFKRISIDTIAGRLAELTQAEQIDVDDRALRYVARAADGSMRDALSLLDQCVAFHFGEKLNEEGAYTDRVLAVKEVFDRCGIMNIIDPDMIKGIWFKFMCNVGENLTCALLGIPFGVFRTSDHANAIRRKAMEEVVLIAQELGVDLGKEDMDRQESTLMALPFQNKPSTLQDLEAGKRTEIDMFAGTVIEYGRKLGIATPVNEMFYHAIHVLEEKCGGSFQAAN